MSHRGLFPSGHIFPEVKQRVIQLIGRFFPNHVNTNNTDTMATAGICEQ